MTRLSSAYLIRDGLMSATLVDLSLVLACYNEELVIEDSVTEIVQVLDIQILITIIL